MRNVSDRISRGYQNTHFVFGNFFSFLELHALCDIMWKKYLELETPQTTIRHMRLTSWITKATDTHSEYLILFAFTWQFLRERAPFYVICTLAVLLSYAGRGPVTDRSPITAVLPNIHKFVQETNWWFLVLDEL